MNNMSKQKLEILLVDQLGISEQDFSYLTDKDISDILSFNSSDEINYLTKIINHLKFYNYYRYDDIHKIYSTHDTLRLRELFFKEGFNLTVIETAVVWVEFSKKILESLDDVWIPNVEYYVQHNFNIILEIAKKLGYVILDVKEIVDINYRWSKGINHDKRSKQIYDFISEYDFKFADDFLNLKSGGDGDNGEHLMYLLDEFFKNKDLQTKSLPEK